MNFIPLASSSHGNAYIVDDGASRILIECGVSFQKLRKLTGFGLTGMQGCLLSHEHKDHAKCYLELIKSGVPVYASEGTAEALGCGLITTVADREAFHLGTFDVLPFPTFHDAAEPLGYLVRSRVDGDKLMFATDTVNLGYEFTGLTLVALECNYDEDILARSTHMPPKVVHRIRNSHMDLFRACAYLRKLDLSRCRRVYLLHLSDACSNEALMVGMAEEACKGVEVVACPKEKGFNKEGGL